MESWRSRPLFVFITVVIGITTETFVYGVVIPLLPFLLKRFPAIIENPADLQWTVSLLLASEAVVGVGLAPVLGLLLDRYAARKWPFVFGLLLLIAAIPVFFATDSLAVLFLARCVQGASGAIIWVVGFDLCFRVSGRENLGLSFGTVVSSAHAGAMGAPALGGFIYDRFGPLAVVGLIEGILAIDLILRLLIAEPGNGEQASDEAPQEEAGANETAPLHPTGPRCEMFADASKRAGSTSTLFSWIPILHCFEDLPFTASVALTTINATLMGAFNATIPLHGKEHFGFDSTGAGLLLLPIAVARVIAGPLGGHLVDRIGSRKVAVAGYLVMSTGLFLVPATMSMSKALAVASLAALLALAGTGLAVVGSACWVEGMCAVRRYHAAHWYLFGDAGPYASLQALNMMTFQLGLAVGPLAAGALRDWIGFGSMSVVLAVVSSISSVVVIFLFDASSLADG